MPVIRIYGVPPGTSQATLSGLINSISMGVAAIEDLEITTQYVTILFPADLFENRVVDEIVVYIDLFNRKARTPDVKKKMAQVVGDLLAAEFAGVSFIEVLPLGYNPDEEGYWSYRRE